MKIGIIADIHDNAHNTVMALQELKEIHKVEQILFLGDFAGAGIAILLKSSPIPIYAIWGNNDGDTSLITKFALSEESNLTVALTTYDIVEYDNRKIFLTHFPQIAMSMARSGDFDAVFYGHNHLKDEQKVKDCIVVNPGELGAYKTGISSYAIYDTEDNTSETFIIENSVTTNTEESKKRFEEIKHDWSQTKGHKLN